MEKNNNSFRRNMWFVIFAACLLITIFVWITQRVWNKDLIPMLLLTGFAFYRFYTLRKIK